MNKDGQKGGEKECHSCDANKNTQKKKKKGFPKHRPGMVWRTLMIVLIGLINKYKLP